MTDNTYDSLFEEDAVEPKAGKEISDLYNKHLSGVKMGLPMTASKPVGRGAYERQPYDPVDELRKMQDDTAFYEEAVKRQAKEYGEGGASNLDTVLHALKADVAMPFWRGAKDTYYKFGAGKSDLDEQTHLFDIPGRPELSHYINKASRGYNSLLSDEKKDENLVDLARFKREQAEEKTNEALLDPGYFDEGQALLGDAVSIVATAAPELFAGRGFIKRGLVGTANLGIDAINTARRKTRFVADVKNSIVGNAPNQNPFRAIDRVENVDNARHAGKNDHWKLLPANLAMQTGIGAVQGGLHEDSTMREGGLIGAGSSLLPLVPVVGSAGRISNRTPDKLYDMIEDVQRFERETGQKLNLTEGNFGSPNAQDFEKRMETGRGTNIVAQERKEGSARTLNEFLKETILPDFRLKNPRDRGSFTPDYLDALRERSQAGYRQHGGGYTYDPSDIDAMVDPVAATTPHIIGNPFANEQLRIMRSYTQQNPSIGPVVPGTPIQGETVQTMLSNIDARIATGLEPAEDAYLRRLRTFIRDQADANNPGATAALDAADTDWAAYSQIRDRLPEIGGTIPLEGLSDLRLPYVSPVTRRVATDDTSNAARVLSSKENKSQLSSFDSNNTEQVAEGQEYAGLVKKLFNLRSFGLGLGASSQNPYFRDIGHALTNFSMSPKQWLAGSPADVLSVASGITRNARMAAQNGGIDAAGEQIKEYDKIREEQERRRNPFIYPQ